MASSKYRGKRDRCFFERDNEAFCQNDINNRYLDGHVDIEVWKLCSMCT